MPTLCLLAAAVLFSTAGIAIKTSGLTAWQIAAARSAVAACTLVAILPGARRGWTRPALAAALPYAATMVLFVVATRLTTAANAIVLQSTAPLYLLLLGPWLLDEPVRRRDVRFLAVMLLGVALVTLDGDHGGSDLPHRTIGNVVAIASGVAWALTVLTLRGLARDAQGPPAATLVAGNLLAVAITAPMAVPVESIAWRDVAAVVYLGTIQIPVAYLFLTKGMQHVRALPASLVLLLEPVLNPSWVWLLHGEAPGALGIAGGALVLVAAAIRAVQNEPDA